MIYYRQEVCSLVLMLQIGDLDQMSLHTEKTREIIKRETQHKSRNCNKELGDPQSAHPYFLCQVSRRRDIPGLHRKVDIWT